jgi:acetate kinase
MISTAASSASIRVIRTNEEAVIARRTRELLAASNVGSEK